MAKQTAGRVEEILRELGKKIDVLIVESREAKDEVRDRVEKEVAELRKRKEKLEKEFQTYKEQEKWTNAKDHFSVALQELRKAVEALISKKSR